MSKRGENIYKRKDGRWEGRYIKERSADGKARYAYVYGKSYADAKQKLLDRRITQAQNIDCSPSHIKYGDILRNWIAMSRIHIKESTYSRYVHLANAHILPYLGELPTSKLTTQTVEKHISFLLNKGRVDKKGGLAPKTVSDILTLIKGSIDYANCSGYSVNCYLDRLTVKKTQLDMRVLSVDEQHRLCDILMRDMNLTKFGVLLCMYTGIRIGEVCALKWERIDFSEGILSIRETLQRIQATDVGACKKTKIVITEPKSKKAVRDIPLPGFVLEYAASLKHNPKAYILTGCSDRYIEPRSLQYTFKKYTQECGLTDVNYHALRHTFATRCIELGFDVKTLSELLGHSSVNITLNRYPQLKSKKIVAASLLNRVSEEDERKLITAGIVCEYLLKLPQTDYSSAVKDIAICEAPVAVPAKIETNYQALFCKNFDNPRKGVQIGRYKHGCEEMAETFLAQFVHKIKNGSSILVLGTEECMYPALRLGAVLEDMGQNYHVRCHATTRSPIGVCTDENYPITSGYKLNSFYDINRPTYIYNLCEYDTVVVVTDTFVKEFTALESLVGALPNKKAVQLFYIQGGKNVWCMKQ